MAGPYRDEIEKLEALYAENPEGRVFTHLAEAYRKAGELDRAREVLESGLKRHEDYSSAHVVMGRVRSDQGDPDGARAAFRRVIELDPHNLVALRALGDLSRKAGDHGSALSYYRDLLALDPSDDDIAAYISEQESGPGIDTAAAREEPSSADEGAVAWPSSWETPDSIGPDVAASSTEPAQAASDEDVGEDEDAGGFDVLAGDSLELDTADFGALDVGAIDLGAGPIIGQEEPAEAAAPDADADADAGGETEEGWGETVDAEVDAFLATESAGDAADADAAEARGEDEARPSEAPAEEVEGAAGGGAAEWADPTEWTRSEEWESAGGWPEPTAEGESADETVEAEGGPAEAETGAEGDAGAEEWAETGGVWGQDLAGLESGAWEMPVGQGPEPMEPEPASGEREPSEPELTAGAEPAEPDLIVGVERPEPDLSGGAQPSGPESPAEAAGAEAESTAPPEAEVYDLGGFGSGYFDSASDEPADRELVTETMAELYIQQGFHERAVEVYRELLRQRPGDGRLEAKLAEAEERSREAKATREQDATGTDAWPSSVGWSPWESDEDEEEPARVEDVEAAWTGRGGATEQDASPYTWSPESGAEPEEETGGSIGDYFSSLLGWHRGEKVAASPELGSLEPASPEPASAESVSPEGAAAPDVEPRVEAEAAGEGEDDDLEMFRAWLQSLKY